MSYSLGLGFIAAPFARYSHDQSKKPDLLSYVRAFLLDTTPRQVYVHLLLRLPTLYFLRVARIFDEADLSLPETMTLTDIHGYISILGMKEPSDPSSPFWNLKVAWEAFINTLLKEWKTLNIISVLLLSAILTMLQLPGAVTEPLILYTSLASLICSLTSLLYGCMYIIRFGSMRKTYRAIAWAKAVQKAKTSIWWNVWVLLAMPAIWLAWSILLFMLGIMTYVWYINPLQPAKMLGTSPAVVPRAILSVLLMLALVYSVLIAITFNQYGEKVDEEWSKSVTDIRASISLNPSNHYNSFEQPPSLGMPKYYNPPSLDRSPLGSAQSDQNIRFKGRLTTHSPTGHLMQPSLPRSSRSTSTEKSSSIASETSQISLTTAEAPLQRLGIPIVPRSVSNKVVGLRFHNHDIFPVPAISEQRGLRKDEWELFVSEICLAWDGDNGTLQDKYESQTHSIRKPQDSVAEVLAVWNEQLTKRHSLQAALCREYTDLYSDSPSWAVYLLDFSADGSGNVPRLAERFGAVPQGFEKIVIFDPRSASGIPAVSTMTTTIARHELDTHVRFRQKSERGDTSE
ncbi:hypothetical protein AX15_001985 [Amanita polypyramis BW_CC]|nr:hypothetical protein AX15_001985 [Amanita polypyramis BW_CC]